MDMLEIHKIETLGALDGPGLRTVVFLQGCPMRCEYCHNPDSWFQGEGQLMTNDAIFSTIMRHKAYTHRNGGVTFSGGEPLMQAKTLLPLVQRLKSSGIHVALDTSGCLFGQDEMRVIDAVDLVILDIKACTEEAYVALTGHGREMPLAVLEYLKEKGKPYWIRQVEYPNLADLESTESDALDRMTHSAYRERLEKLPYHTMGETKKRVIKT